MSLTRLSAAIIMLVALCLGDVSIRPVTAANGPQPFPVFFPAAEDSPLDPQVILAIAIDAGYNHSCLINIFNQVFCWGNNDYGQLGDGTTSSSRAPMRVIGLSEGAVMISAGYRHSCAITPAGAAKCWGAGGSGQLGDNRWTDSKKPVTVSGLTTDTVDISAGYLHTCAVVGLGAARCWGSGGYGQLGNNGTSSSGVPVTPTGLTANVLQIGAGEQHTCARMQGGGVKCWGDNYFGQLGTGNQTWSQVPVNTLPLGGSVVQLAVGTYGNCIREIGGGVQCWGFRAIVGDGTNVCYNGVGPSGNPWVTSARWIVNMSSNVTDIAVGNGHACAVKDGGAWCWGDGRQGELGNGATPPLEVCTPVAVTGLTAGVARVSVGKSHTLALLTGGLEVSSLLADESGVRAWGKNDQGQLGDGNPSNATTPVQVLPPHVKSYLPVVLK